MMGSVWFRSTATTLRYGIGAGITAAAGSHILLRHFPSGFISLCSTALLIHFNPTLMEVHSYYAYISFIYQMTAYISAGVSWVMIFHLVQYFCFTIDFAFLLCDR